MPNTGKRTVHKRHDTVCAQLHFNNIYKEKGVQLDKKHCYEHVPKSVEASQGGKSNRYGSPGREHLEVTVTRPHHKSM